MCRRTSPCRTIRRCPTSASRTPSTSSWTRMARAAGEAWEPGMAEAWAREPETGTGRATAATRAAARAFVLFWGIGDAQENPQNPKVVRALGMGLDEKAMEAVRKYKFKPA